MMSELYEKLKIKYADQIESLSTIGPAEIAITLKPNTDERAFSQELQNQLVELIDHQTIIKIDILNSHNEVVDSFATNQ